MLKLQGIKKDYVTSSETVHALRGVDISFRKNEFVSILGPSGCGKTTLLNIIGGLDHYTDGDLVINGKSTHLYTDRDWDVYRNHRVGFIFQSYNLIPHQTVLGNVELALTIAGVGREERVERAKRALDRVGLAGQYYKKPNQLSGGQCQRVAIARALVNDPEILLADEPTGALDTVTSVQIMELIKEISGERLVIMVTHNPELAEKYSSRIVRLLDGNVVEDTNPLSAKDEELELLVSENEKKEEPKPTQKKKKEKAKMSFLTAFRLSARNLFSKKGRTTMVGIAGSIGIIGIALVLAFSAGIKGYIASMQDDMLSGNPITITESTYDLDALTGMMDMSDLEQIEKEYGKVYVSSIVEYLAKTGKNLEEIAVENIITEEYVEYVKNMPSEYYEAMLLKYGIDLNNNLFVDFKLNGEREAESYSVAALTAMYTSILKKTEFKDYASYISMLAPSMSQLPDSKDYLLTQYDLVSGEFAEGKNDIMLVLSPDDELSDLLLARFGFYTQEEFLEIVEKATSEDGSYNEDLYKPYFEYDELVGKEMTWYPNGTVFEKVELPEFLGGGTTFTYKHSADDFDDKDSVKLNVVGILTPKDTVNYGSISSGIYYTEELTEHILDVNADSDIIHYIEQLPEDNTTASAVTQYYFPYSYTYYFDTNEDGVYSEDELYTEPYGAIGPSMSMSDMMGSMMGGSSSEFDHAGTKERLIRNLGGNDDANNISIFPKSFDEKDLVTSYLDKWNEDHEQGITYTDTLELVISIINTMIDVVSYALIAFTSVSLVVSTVMIGIITYVSVVERIKEIGVIRSLGGRKRDVSNLFIAETFIIGLLAGLIGVGTTYILSAIVNLILKPLINYPNIAALPISNAIILVLLSIGLTLVSGLLPAKSAAKKDPVVALRTE